MNVIFIVTKLFRRIIVAISILSRPAGSRSSAIDRMRKIILMYVIYSWKFSGSIATLTNKS